MNDGSKLLELFRGEQAKKGNLGCTCSDCQKDMQHAYEKFKEGLK